MKVNPSLHLGHESLLRELISMLIPCLFPLAILVSFYLFIYLIPAFYSIQRYSIAFWGVVTSYSFHLHIQCSNKGGATSTERVIECLGRKASPEKELPQEGDRFLCLV